MTTHEETLLLGFSFLPKKQVMLTDCTVSGLVNTLNKGYDKDLGGYEPDYSATIMCKQSELTGTPQSYIGTELTIAGDGTTWRVKRVRTGAITSFELVSEHKA